MPQYSFNLILTKVHFAIEKQGHRTFCKAYMFREVFCFDPTKFYCFIYLFSYHN